MKLELPKPHFSYSQMSTWQYSKEQYLERYVLNKKMVETPSLLYGSQVSKWLESGKWDDAPKDTQKVLKKVKRYAVPEYKLEAEFTTPLGTFNFLGFLDTYDPKNRRAREYKTGEKEWTNKRAQEHLQTLIYAGILFKRFGEIPEFHLDWIPTKVEDGVARPLGKIKTFPLKINAMRAMIALKQMCDTALEIHVWYSEYKKTAHLRAGSSFEL